MNIFFLSLDPKEAAKWHCDKHVVKMLLETIQILYTVHWLRQPATEDNEWNKECPLTNAGTRGYKKTHVKHPSVLWTTESQANYQWLCQLGNALQYEFNTRFGKSHSAEPHLAWLNANVPPFAKDEQEWTEPKIAMVPECKEYAAQNNLSVVESYHHYYITSKLYFLSYRNLDIPPWLREHFSPEENYKRLGLHCSASVNLYRAALLGDKLEKDTREAFGVHEDESKEKHLIDVVKMQKESPRKWGEVVKNGTRITNAIKRALGDLAAELKYETPFDKKPARKRKRKVVEIENDDKTHTIVKQEVTEVVEEDVEPPRKRYRLRTRTTSTIKAEEDSKPDVISIKN